MVGFTGVLDESAVLTEAVAAEGSLGGSKAMLVVPSHDLTVGPRLGGLEIESIEEVEVVRSAMALVVGVASDADLARSRISNEVLLRGENGIHGNWGNNMTQSTAAENNHWY